MTSKYRLVVGHGESRLNTAGLWQDTDKSRRSKDTHQDVKRI